MSDPQDELGELSEALRGHLETARRRGRTRVPVPPTTTVPAAAREATPAPAPVVAPARARVPAGVVPAARVADVATDRGKKLPLLDIEPEPSDHAERAGALAALAREVSACTRCSLCETRKQTVFSRGRGRTRVMFIGEAPGADEDAQGFPFVGRAGQLLDQIIDAVGFSRDEIYVANILKCRPPENRDPRPGEVEACTPHLVRQIELVDPKILCALGRHAAQFLTGQPGAPMGKLRGKIHYYQGRIRVLPTYHPAALLRNPEWKRAVWEDVQILRQEYLR